MKNNYKIFDGCKVLYEPFAQSKNRIGLYHPLNNEIYVFDNNEWNTFDNIETGSENIIKQFRDLNIIHHKDEKIEIDINYKPDDAQMYVKLTEACNFACPGCTTSIDRIQAGQAKTLTPEILSTFLESFIRSAHEKQMTKVKIKWAGGESLLKMAYDLIVSAQPTIKKLAVEYTDVKIKQVVLTNGVFINQEKIDFFKQNNITLSVSLWGIGRVQDESRKPRNKIESYELIASNINLLHQNNMDYSINFVLTPFNAHNFYEFIETVWDINSPKFIGKDWAVKKPVTLFIAFYRPQTGISKEYAARMYDTMLIGLKHGFGKIKELIENDVPIQTLNIIDYINMTGISPYTCGSGLNYVAIGSDGAASCHEGLYQMASNLEKIKSGANLIDLVNEEHKDEIKYMNGLYYYGKKGFDYLFLHGGLGCPRLRKAENKGDISKMGMTSRFYRSFIDDLLSLECMRLSKVVKEESVCLLNR